MLWNKKSNNTCTSVRGKWPFQNKTKSNKQDHNKMSSSKNSSVNDEASLSPTSLNSSSSTLGDAAAALDLIEEQEQQQHPVVVPVPELKQPCVENSITPEGEEGEDVSKYGYEDAAPVTTETNVDIYGYGDAAPDISDDERVAKYGYGDAVPDYDWSDNNAVNMYGYGNASFPETSFSAKGKTPRRSSMKQQSDDGRRATRRASITLCGEIENVLPSSTGFKKVKRRTSITFNETVNIKDIAPVRDLTEDPEALWFQDDEFDHIRNKAAEIVHKVDVGSANTVKKGKSKKICTRGLEKYTSKHKEIVMDRKYTAWDSVLVEQEHQRQYHQYDDEHLANVCKLTTFQSQREATERANQDAADIEAYLRSARRHCRRLSM